MAVPTARDFAEVKEAIERAQSRYRPVKAISKGAFGQVLLAQDALTGEATAIKALRIGPNDATKDIAREIVNHEKLLHAHVVRFKQAFAAAPYLCIAMEFVPGGDLLDYINETRGGLSENEARYIFQQLVMAVDYCHSVGVMNRDIKPENTLLVRMAGKPPMVKLADFGYAKSLDDSAPATRAGTLHYVAPEVMMNVRPHVYDGMKADTWSCGVLLFVMLFCSFPFAEPEGSGSTGGLNEYQQMHRVMRRMACGDFSFPSWKPISPECQDLIRHLLTPEHTQRFSVDDIKRHPWFQKNLLPGTLEYNAKALAMPRVMPQSEEEIRRAIEQSRVATPASDSARLYNSYLESDEDEEEFT